MQRVKRQSIVRGLNADMLLSGCEVNYFNAGAVDALPGIVAINGRILTRIANSTLRGLNVAGNWLHGAEGASMWVYIYAYNDSGQSWDIMLSDEIPNASDCLGNAAGILRFKTYAGVWYRCIGAVYNNAAQNLLKWYQAASWVYWDIPVLITTVVSAGAWALAQSCALGMPRISRLAFFNVFYNDTGTTAQFFMRPAGAVWGINLADGAQNYRDTATQPFLMMTSPTQTIDYYNGAGDDGDFEIKIFGYSLERVLHG